ncbi:MAG: [FeFe] hydrogenase H-cluster maturation GTPase HydF [Endomicrobia bacterium]|nr:[FeFe] hydrogenase H-cluster maturation GTPase HydF [Endomicrobiia bacterium]MCL2507093.1 [FeFe] hydrogenase H-cluster maturation GTPase HydF [Endomicrobiia bacterium]
MKAFTIQIGIFGRTNSGKSSLMNFITNQNTSIVSQISGTTTDVVSKQIEINPLGPVTLFDTAGIGDSSALGSARMEKTKEILNSSDVVLLLAETDKFGDLEIEIIQAADRRKTPVIIVISKNDLNPPDSNFIKELGSYSKNVLQFSSVTGNRDNFLNELKKILFGVLPENYIENYSPLKDIIKNDDTVILVMPIDAGAPRGKIIMPQIQTIRHILDLNACSYIAQDSQYQTILNNLKVKPVIVITDSQSVKKIAAITPADVKLTTFSTIFAADKSDIIEMAKGASALSTLKDGDKILISEACTHHASADDIGRIKLPKWIKEYAGQNIEIVYANGQDFPNIEELKTYKVIVHCGACTLNRKNMLARLNKAVEAGVPITNYGIAISVMQGVIEKVLEVFPEALKAYKQQLINNKE